MVLDQPEERGLFQVTRWLRCRTLIEPGTRIAVDGWHLLLPVRPDPGRSPVMSRMHRLLDSAADLKENASLAVLP